MTDMVNRLKVEHLIKACKILEGQFKAVSEELTLTIDPEKRTLLESRLHDLEEKLSQKEKELGDLKGVIRGTENEKAQIIRRQPHEVFPYLLDRNEQEDSLVQALEAHRLEKATRPFVCVLHGDEFECHPFYLERIIRSLPGVLSAWHPLEAKNTPIQQFSMQLPLNKMTKSEYERSLWLRLRAATHDSKPVSEEEIVNFVASHKLSVIIKCSLLTEDLKHISLNSIDWFFKFWEKWPKISNLLFVVISFKYQRNNKWKLNPRNWSTRRLNQQIREYLNRLDFSEHRDIYGTVLPELAAIPRRDAEALIWHPQVSSYSCLDDQSVRVLYDNRKLCTPDGCIPMETLLDRLIDICNENRRLNSRRL